MAGWEIGELGKWHGVSGDPDPDDDEELTEIAGDDDDIAAARRLLAMAGGSHAGENPRRIRHRTADRGQFVDLPFPLTIVPALGTADAVARPQETFRPQRLIVDPSAGLAINLIIIGRSVQFVATTGVVPAATFAFNALGTARHFKTAQIAQDVVVRLQNLTGAPITASLAFSGPAVY